MKRGNTDKKFRALSAQHHRAQYSTACEFRGTHLERVDVSRRGFPRAVARVVANRVSQVPYLPSSPKIDGVRMHWVKGWLVPRPRKSAKV